MVHYAVARNSGPEAKGVLRVDCALGKPPRILVEPLPLFALRCWLSDMRSLPKYGKGCTVSSPMLLAGSMGPFTLDSVHNVFIFLQFSDV